jgi:sec-independent protein translocase protein TatA
MYLPAGALFGLGVTELVIILVIVLVLFGPKKLPEIGKALGSTMRELRKSSQDDKEAVKAGETETAEPAKVETVVEEKEKATS